jgi:hypothetical protein
MSLRIRVHRYDGRVTVRRAACLLAVSIAVVAACGTSGPTGSPVRLSPAVAPGSTEAVLTPVPGGVATPRAGPTGTPSQTDTDWGRIWDALPDSFPRPGSSIPADSIEGPVSAAFSVGASPSQVVDTMQAALDGAGYQSDLSGPLEDGGFVFDSTGTPDGCRVQTTVKPLSGTTLMTVRFGAACRFE